MLEWFRRSKKTEQGWLAISLEAGAVGFVHGQFSSSGPSAISRCGARTLEANQAGPDRLARELPVGRFQCATLLRPGEYQLLLVEAPTVPRDELKSALRWRIKDMVDYHMDDATLDVLDIPPERSGAAGNHSMYAVSARNDVIQARIKQFEDARIPLSVIDIPETAQRNIAALFESEGRGLALLYLGNDFGLLTINFGGELYLGRRIDAGIEQLKGASEQARESAMNRILVELQRTFDHFERQFRHVSVTQLLLGPEPEDTGLLAYLSANLGLPVARVELAEKLAFQTQEPPGPAEQWRLFHLMGASLRHEDKVL